jgi:hypothetical protein
MVNRTTSPYSLGEGERRSLRIFNRRKMEAWNSGFHFLLIEIDFSFKHCLSEDDAKVSCIVPENRSIRLKTVVCSAFRLFFLTKVGVVAQGN